VINKKKSLSLEQNNICPIIKYNDPTLYAMFGSLEGRESREEGREGK
jgi:hypothetical protein